MFLAGNFYGDTLLKGEYALENPDGGFSYSTTTRSPVVFLLFNDPDLTAEPSKDSLPLTRYFGSPNGMMVARTGWDVNASDPAQSDDVVAMMKIGERWGANHHHLDAGSFQLYYKGILASESGYYESYGSLHDQNYNKASIAHNVLTIYDPNEKFGSYTGTDKYGNTVSFRMASTTAASGGRAASRRRWRNGARARTTRARCSDYAFGAGRGRTGVFLHQGRHYAGVRRQRAGQGVECDARHGVSAARRRGLPGDDGYL